MIRLSALSLLLLCSLHSMEKPPHLIRVSTANQTDHWDLEKDVVVQMGVLVHQIEDGIAAPFLPGGVGPKRFEKILRLLKNPSTTKVKLSALASKQVVDIATIADSLAADRVLAQSLAVLCKRPLAESQNLSDPLKQALIARAVGKNHYLKMVLLKERDLNTIGLKDTDRMKDRYVSVQRVLKAIDEKTFQCLDTRTKKYHTIDCVTGLEVHLNYYPLLGHSVVYDLASDKAIYYITDDSLSYLVMCDLRKSLLLQKWPCPWRLNSMVIHENGVAAIAHYNPNIFFGNLDSSEWKVLKPFTSSYLLSMVINKSKTKVVVGSAQGQIALFDLNEREKKPLFLGSQDTALLPTRCQNQIVALTFNPKDDSMIACASSFNLICLLDAHSKTEFIFPEAGILTQSILFNNAGDLLITAGGGNKICIWSVLLKQLLHKIESPKVHRVPDSGIEAYQLSFSPDDRLLMLTNESSVIKLINEETAKSIEFLPLPVVDFLIEIGKQMTKNAEYITLPSNYKELYTQLPQNLKDLIKKNVSWKNWVWL